MQELIYRMTANSFRGNFSLTLCTVTLVTVHTGVETIQGRKLFKGGNYSRKYGTYYLLGNDKVSIGSTWDMI